MSYVSVKQNELGEWSILKYLSSNINQVSPLTGMTIGNLIYLSAQDRVTQGFWLFDEVYVNSGEFVELDYIDTNMDDVDGRVTKTYYFKLLDLSIIKEDMKNRTRTYREQLSQSTYDNGSKVYNLSGEARTEMQGLVLEAMLNPSLQNVTIGLLSGESLVLTIAELNSIFLEISVYRNGLFDIEAQIIAAIDAATDYESIRAAAVWGNQPL